MRRKAYNPMLALHAILDAGQSKPVTRQRVKRTASTDSDALLAAFDVIDPPGHWNPDPPSKPRYTAGQRIRHCPDASVTSAGSPALGIGTVQEDTDGPIVTVLWDADSAAQDVLAHDIRADD